MGNPTILASLAVVGAILSIRFCGGLSATYMRPIPIGATAAIVMSLILAFLVTPWVAVRILKQGVALMSPQPRISLLKAPISNQIGIYGMDSC